MHRAGGPIRPIVAPCGSHIVFATVAGLRLVGGADQALSGCELEYVKARQVCPLGPDEKADACNVLPEGASPLKLMKSDPA